MIPARRIAIIGAGPAGAIAIDACAQEKAFDLIRVFERREKPGGCWLQDPESHPPVEDFAGLAQRTADRPVEIPAQLPAQRPRLQQERYAETSVYPYLETNVVAPVMEFSQEPIPVERSERGIALHGPETDFRPWQTMQRYVQGLVDRNGYQDLVECNTTVERVQKVGGEWEVTLRKQGGRVDTWWKEYFDGVVVASGHFTVPYIPHVDGLAAFEKAYPGSVEHSKAYRGKDKYRGKKVVVVGASVSGADIAVDLLDTAQTPVHAVVKGHRANLYFGDVAFKHPDIREVPSISKIESADGQRTVHLVDGSKIEDVDNIIFGTGYSWTLPFLPQIPVRNNRVPGLYMHVVHQSDPTLVFVGGVAAGLTFKVYEWQAVLAARILAGRAALPSLEEQKKWESDRIAKKGDGAPFTALWPDMPEYFESVRKLAGEPTPERPGRKLPPFDMNWITQFTDGHQKRIRMWERLNDEARNKVAQAAPVKARL